MKLRIRSYHLFDKIKPCIKQDEGTFIFARNLPIVFNNLPLILMKMELTEDHDIQLAKEILGSEPYRFKP